MLNYHKNDLPCGSWCFFARMLWKRKHKWDKAFKSGLSNFLKVVFHKFYLVHCWILCPTSSGSWSEIQGKSIINSNSFLGTIIRSYLFLKFIQERISKEEWSFMYPRNGNPPKFNLQYKVNNLNIRNNQTISTVS